MKRTRVIVTLVLIVGALAWVAARGLTANLVYYSTPTELLRQGADAVGERMRLGGVVVAGSIQEGQDALTFVVSDGTSRVTVTATGSVPTLFREGQGVVLEGTYAADGTFHADTVLVKHGSDYRPPAPGETPHRYEPGG